VGPAGLTSRSRGGFVFTLSIWPNGLGGTVPSFRNQRRLKTSSGTASDPHATVAGCKRDTASVMARRMPAAAFSRQAAAASEPPLPEIPGALCVCVAAINIWSVFQPVASAARTLISSSVSRPTPRLSTMTITARPLPFCIAKARAWSGSCTLSVGRGVKDPRSERGNFSGVMSTTAVPA